MPEELAERMADELADELANELDVSTLSTMSSQSTSRTELLSLPTELLSDIIALTRPEGFAPFVSTCKLIYDVAIARDLLSVHATLQKQWSSWSVPPAAPFNPFKVTDLGHETSQPLVLLCEIQKTPLIAAYMRHVCLRECGNPLSEEAMGPMKEARDYLRTENRLISMLQKSPYLLAAKQDVKRWHEKILDDHTAQYTFIFLLTLLPNVSSLKLPPAWGSEEWRSTALHEDGSRRIDNDLTAVLRTLSGKSNDKAYGALKRLVSVFCTRDRLQSSIPLQTLEPFLLLPSVRYLRGINLEADDLSHDFEWHRFEAQTSVETLSMNHSTISATHARKLFRGMHNLKSLFWAQFVPRNGTGREWDGGASVTALLDSPARDTLESFSLYFEGEKHGSSITTFKQFSVLQNLRLDVILLAGGPDHGRGDLADPFLEPPSYQCSKDIRCSISSRLVDILPPTLRSLSLCGRPEVEGLDKLFEGIDDLRKNCPELREIEMYGFEMRSVRDRRGGIRDLPRIRLSLSMQGIGLSIV